MVVRGRIKKGAYFDSVTLMTVAKRLTEMADVVDAAAVMGSDGNKAILAASSLTTSEFESAGDTDLLIGVQATSEAAAEQALSAVDELLEQVRQKNAASGDVRPRSLEGAVQILPDANLALISIAGRYAGHEARKALENGLHVMLFSDNVPLETEIALKQFAQKKRLMVMGPDCGSAIITGVPLAFANVVRRGPIGIVAASGTGLQEVSTIVSNQGAGISQGIGTGGRDVQQEVGGIMFLAAMQALAEDEDTRVIVLVSKPPAAKVLSRIEAKISEIDKPVVPVFLGAESRGPEAATTLLEAALRAVALAQGTDSDEVTRLLTSREQEIVKRARKEAAGRSSGQKYLRGLMSGGTFVAECQLLLCDKIGDVFSNAPLPPNQKLSDSLVSQANSVVDLGADEFTVGRPHPMIDYSLRKQRIIAEANDPETAVILLDVVLGYGAHPDPATELAAVVHAACQRVCVVCSITGTDQDPQNLTRTRETLTVAGAIVMPSHAEASQLAGYIVKFRGES